MDIFYINMCFEDETWLLGQSLDVVKGPIWDLTVNKWGSPPPPKIQYGNGDIV